MCQNKAHIRASIKPWSLSGSWTPAVRDFTLCSRNVHIIFCAPSIWKSWIRPWIGQSVVPLSQEKTQPVPSVGGGGPPQTPQLPAQQHPEDRAAFVATATHLPGSLWQQHRCHHRAGDPTLTQGAHAGQKQVRQKSFFFPTQLFTFRTKRTIKCCCFCQTPCCCFCQTPCCYYVSKTKY